MIRPIRTNVLIKPCEADSISEGGIFVPDSFKPISNKGVVMAVGNGTKKSPMRFKKGDICFRVKDHGTELHENGETFFLMDQQALLATI